MSETKHILGLSGGKDSAALAVHMNKKYPDLNIEYFFTDTGYELKETYDFLNKLKTRLDKPIHYINPRNSFDYFLKKYNNFLPSPTARWCTIEMKLKSMEAWLKPALDAGQEIITYVGIRYDERGRVGYKPTNNLIKAKFPFIDDCIGLKVEEKCKNLKPGEVLLLENLRFYDEETKGDEIFARELSKLADIYINDAFGTAHRAHASTTTVAKYFSIRAPGYLLKKV